MTMVYNCIAGFLFLWTLGFICLSCGKDDDNPVVPNVGTVEVRFSPSTIEAPWSLITPTSSTIPGECDSVFTSMPIGNYSIIWGAVPGWLAPEDESRTLSNNETIEFSGTYVEIPPEEGTIVVNPGPNSINAPWDLAGPNSYDLSGSGDITIEDMATGEYIVTWGAVPGWVVPEDETQTLSNNETIEFSGTYTEENPFTLFIKTDGRDSRSGLTLGNALKTLSGAHARLKEYKPTIDVDIEIRIQYISGQPYNEQTVNWTHTSQNHTITFMPSDYYYGAGINDIAGRPIFDGQGKEDWFFDLRSQNGEATNVQFYYLKIEGYIPGGIRFYGSEPNWSQWNGYNRVFGCYFYDLGNKNYNNAVGKGYGAIDLVNSDHNYIRNNHFIHLENRSADAELLHAVYLAHNSEYNIVSGNRFYYVSGDPIRTRNYSNYNEVRGNKFERTGSHSFISDWHDSGECRSWENEFRDNTPLKCGYSGQTFAYYWFWNDGNPEGSHCAPLPRRLYTSGNDPVTCP